MPGFDASLEVVEEALEIWPMRILGSQRHSKNCPLNWKSPRDPAGQLLNDMPVVHSTTNKPHTFAHHFEKDVLPFRADHNHVSEIHN